MSIQITVSEEEAWELFQILQEKEGTEKYQDRILYAVEQSKRPRHSHYARRAA